MEDLKAEFTDEEWKAATDLISMPQKNRFVPEDTSTIVKPEQRLKHNKVPKEIKWKEGVNLYHVLDHVYLKPSTIINILLRIKQPENRYN